jgi:hypothetical protein
MIERIPDLDYNGLIPVNGFFPWYDPNTDTTYYARADDFLFGMADPNDAWNPFYNYAEGDIATEGGIIYISNSDDNEGNPPGPDSPFWDEDESGGGPGLGPYWPLGGSDSLTANVELLGEGFDVSIGTLSERVTNFLVGAEGDIHLYRAGLPTNELIIDSDGILLSNVADFFPFADFAQTLEMNNNGLDYTFIDNLTDVEFYYRAISNGHAFKSRSGTSDSELSFGQNVSGLEQGLRFYGDDNSEYRSELFIGNNAGAPTFDVQLTDYLTPLTAHFTLELDGMDFTTNDALFTLNDTTGIIDLGFSSSQLGLMINRPSDNFSLLTTTHGLNWTGDYGAMNGDTLDMLAESFFSLIVGSSDTIETYIDPLNMEIFHGFWVH